MAWARVQGNTLVGAAPAASSVSVTLASAVGSGNLICVSVGYGATATTCTVTDDKSNSYTAGNSATDATSAYTWMTFYFINATNGPKTITATVGTNEPFLSIMADEYSGGGAATIDGHTIQSQHTPPTGTNGITSGSITTTQNGDLIYGCSVNIPGSGTQTVGTGFTQDQAVSATFFSEHLTQASAGSTAGTYTNGSSPASITAVMAFAPAGVAGPALRAVQLGGFPVGRMAGYKNLLNAAAPVTAVAPPPTTGGTLPFMGVG